MQLGPTRTDLKDISPFILFTLNEFVKLFNVIIHQFSVDGPNENGEQSTEKASMNANDINEKTSNNLIKSK